MGEEDLTSPLEEEHVDRAANLAVQSETSARSSERCRIVTGTLLNQHEDSMASPTLAMYRDFEILEEFFSRCREQNPGFSAMAIRSINDLRLAVADFCSIWSQEDIDFLEHCRHIFLTNQTRVVTQKMRTLEGRVRFSCEIEQPGFQPPANDKETAIIEVLSERNLEFIAAIGERNTTAIAKARSAAEADYHVSESLSQFSVSTFDKLNEFDDSYWSNQE